MEYMVLPVRKDVPTTSREKVGRPVFFEVDLETINSPEELNRELESRILARFGRSATTKVWLILPTDDAEVLTVRPSIETEREDFQSYRDL